MDGFMAQFFTDGISYDWTALLLRWTVGFALLPFGIRKVRDTSGADKFHAVLVFSPKISFYLAMTIETLASICMILGFCTRFAAIPGICNMAIATKVSLGPSFTSPALPFLLGFISILISGPGKFSLDWLFF